MGKLQRIPNLLDMVSNPFMLTLTLEAFPTLIIPQNHIESITITRVNLYDNFVDNWLSVSKSHLETCSLGREARKAFDQLLNRGFEQQGVNFAKSLAAAIFNEQDGRPVVQYPNLVDGQAWKEEFFGPDPEAEHLRMSIPFAPARKAISLRSLISARVLLFSSVLRTTSAQR